MLQFVSLVISYFSWYTVNNNVLIIVSLLFTEATPWNSLTQLNFQDRKKNNEAKGTIGCWIYIYENRDDIRSIELPLLLLLLCSQYKNIVHLSFNCPNVIWLFFKIPGQKGLLDDSPFTESVYAPGFRFRDMEFCAVKPTLFFVPYDEINMTAPINLTAKL